MSTLLENLFPRGAVVAEVYPEHSYLPRRICNGVWPAHLRRTLLKWEASENPARRPTSAVVTRSNRGD
jgi:hypothetical protein